MESAARSVHVSDDMIDAYWKGRLSADDEQRLEEHYLDCAECRVRVGAVEALIDALHQKADPATEAVSPVRAWQIAAAVLAAVAVVTTWQWQRASRGAAAPVESSALVALQTNAGALPALVVALEPPTRGASATSVLVPASTTIVVFELDVREAAAPGAPVDISLTDPNGRVLLRVAMSVSPAGRVTVPVSRGLFTAGQFVFRVTQTTTSLDLPVLIDLVQPR